MPPDAEGGARRPPTSCHSSVKSRGMAEVSRELLQAATGVVAAGGRWEGRVPTSGWQASGNRGPPTDTASSVSNAFHHRCTTNFRGSMCTHVHPLCIYNAAKRRDHIQNESVRGKKSIELQSNKPFSFCFSCKLPNC